MLDKIDKKLLYQLDLNCRQSNAQIGRIIGVSKQVIEYRINKLQSQGIISRFPAVINIFKLGLHKYKVFFTLDNFSAKILQAFVDFLTKEETEWVVKVGGGYDVIVSYLVEDAKELYDKLERVHAKFEKHILKKEISEVLSVPHFPKNYLLSVKSLARPYDFEQGDVVAIDSKDELLLKTIANNARMSLVDLAKELSLSPRGAMLRMKKLEKVGVVLNYRVALNIHKLGWIFTKAYFSLRHLDTSSFRSIKEYCNKSPYVIHVIQCVGRWDLEIDFEIPSYKHFYDFMLDFRTTFSGLIREFDYSIIMEDVKLDYYPGAKTAIVSKN